MRPRLGTKTSELAKTDLEFGASGPENLPKEFELISLACGAPVDENGPKNRKWRYDEHL